MSMNDALMLAGAAIVIVGFAGGRFSPVLAAKLRWIVTVGVVVFLCGVAIKFGPAFMDGVREALK